MKKNNIGATRLKKGAVTKESNGKVIDLETTRQTWAEEAKCGCGIDCCTGTITLPGQPGTAAEGKFFTIAVNPAGTGITVTEKV